MTKHTNQKSILMLGASGAVGTATLHTLLQCPNIQKLTLLGRNPIANIDTDFVQQHKINVSDSKSYQQYLTDHNTAICTLGVGQPSKVSTEDFVNIDKLAALDFAKECKKKGVAHFELLSSVGISPKAFSFYLRTKGELVEELKSLHFERLSIFKPSMILTQTNRYGFSQAVLLKVWPLLKPLLIGSLSKYRGVPIDVLGKAIAKNVFKEADSFEELQWDEFYAVIQKTKVDFHQTS